MAMEKFTVNKNAKRSSDQHWLITHCAKISLYNDQNMTLTNYQLINEDLKVGL